MTGNTDKDPMAQGQEATAETLLLLIEQSREWLKKMERDSIKIIILLIAIPLGALEAVTIGAAEIALLGDFFIPVLILVGSLLFAIIAILIQRHLAIKKEIKQWDVRLQALRNKTNELLSQL